MKTPLMDALFLELSEHASVQTEIERLQEDQIIELKQAARELLSMLPTHYQWSGGEAFPHQVAFMKLESLL